MRHLLLLLLILRIIGLNPYSNGMKIELHLGDVSRKSLCVLILILMEYAL